MHDVMCCASDFALWMSALVGEGELLCKWLNEMTSTPSTGDDTGVMFLPGAIIKSCVSCMPQGKIRFHRAVNSTIP